MPSDSEKKVNIFGQVYTIRGHGDPDHIREAAEVVDQKMNAIAAGVPYSESFRVAVLAALHLADEYLLLQKEYDDYRSRVNETSRKLDHLLDQGEQPNDHPAPLRPAAD